MLSLNYDYNKYWVIHCPSIMDKLIEVYHTVDIKEIEAKRFYNVNFDFVLSIIGNYYKKEEDTSSVYSIAYDVIVKDANINNKKKSMYKYWVSKKQIKALRKAFKKLLANEYFVRIPFNTINILNSVYVIIENIGIHEKSRIQNSARNLPISTFLAKEYIELYIKEWGENPQLRELDRAQDLYNEINNGDQISNQIMR